jgi:hypothetical protein
MKLPPQISRHDAPGQWRKWYKRIVNRIIRRKPISEESGRIEPAPKRSFTK